MALILVLGSFPTTGTPRHNTHYTQLYQLSPTSLFSYVLCTSSTQHMHHLTRAHCYTPFLLNLPNPCYAYVSFLAKPQLPTIQVSKSPMMLCIVVVPCFVTTLLGPYTFPKCALHHYLLYHTALKRLVNTCTPISGVIDSIHVELQQDQQTCCKLNFIK